MLYAVCVCVTISCVGISLSYLFLCQYSIRGRGARHSTRHVYTRHTYNRQGL